MTTYTKYGVSLTQGQKDSLRAAVNAQRSLTLRLSHNQLSGSDQLMLTNMQINKINKAKLSAKGVDIKLSQTQIKKTGGFLGTLLASLAGPLLAGLFSGKGLQLPGTSKSAPVTYTGGATRRARRGLITDAMIRRRAKAMGYRRVVKGSGLWSFIKGLFT